MLASPLKEQEYSISQWHDTDKVLAQLDALVAQPMRPIRRDKMADYLDYFKNRCVRSKEMTDKAKALIPGGVQHNLAFNYPFPIAIEKADGAYMWDVDGNVYIDFLQAGGPTVLGSNYAPVREKVIEVIRECGPVTGLFHEYELKLAELINRHMPAVEMFRMLGSGHRRRHGGDSGGAGVYRQAQNYQSGRRVSRLERPDGLRLAHPGHGRDGSDWYSGRRPQSKRRNSSRTTWQNCAKC